MSLVKRNDTMFPALMNEIFRPDWFGGTNDKAVALPPVNIAQHDNGFELALAVPGRSKEDFTIAIENGTLTVSTIKEKEEEPTELRYTRREFAVLPFRRVFTLPDTVDSDAIAANYEHGILSFSLPIKEEALPKPKRLIALD